MSAVVIAPGVVRTRLQLGSAASLEVSLNGRVVYKGRPGSGSAEPDQAGVDVELRQGRNRLLFRATYAGGRESLYARLLDPERRLQYPESPN